MVAIANIADVELIHISAYKRSSWLIESVEVTGQFSVWTHQGDSGNRASFRFCPECGSTVAYVTEGMPGITTIALGAFADPNFPPPHYSVYEERKHAWVAIVGEDIEHFE